MMGGCRGLRAVACGCVVLHAIAAVERSIGAMTDQLGSFSRIRCARKTPPARAAERAVLPEAPLGSFRDLVIAVAWRCSALRAVAWGCTLRVELRDGAHPYEKNPGLRGY